MILFRIEFLEIKRKERKRKERLSSTSSRVTLVSDGRSTTSRIHSRGMKNKKQGT